VQYLVNNVVITMRDAVHVLYSTQVGL